MGNQISWCRKPFFYSLVVHLILLHQDRLTLSLTARLLRLQGVAWPILPALALSRNPFLHYAFRALSQIAFPLPISHQQAFVLKPHLLCLAYLISTYSGSSLCCLSQDCLRS